MSAISVEVPDKLKEDVEKWVQQSKISRAAMLQLLLAVGACMKGETEAKEFAPWALAANEKYGITQVRRKK